MKLNLLPFSLVALSVLSVISNAQEQKSKKKLKEQPKLAVVQIADQPPIIETPAPQKPSNGSLFTDTAAGGGLFADFKARRVGDLVFVEIDETSTATVTSGAERDRDSGTLGGIVTAAGALPVPGAAVAGGIVGALGTRKFEGSGATERQSNVRARVAARVVEVLPNGDLRIEALKLVRINKETEQVALTGIVRPNDLDKDNSVETDYIGNLRVEFNGKGVASADNAPGWLFRLFDKVTPF